MTARTKTPLVEAPLVTALAVLGMLLATGSVDAFYAPAGAKPDGAGGHMNPDDGMCVVGVAADGTMLVDWSITNARDCVAYTTGLTGMTTQTACINAGGSGNDGYRHTWSTSNTCINDADPTTAISLVDLDRTVAMCTSKGGDRLATPGTCVAYGWIYRNRKADNTLPISGTGTSTTDGVQASDGLGFCYTAIRMTGGTYTSATCPSVHNSPATAPAGEWLPCASSATGCQTQASYDAGLAWSFTGGNCVYTFGLTGTSNTAVTNAAGVTIPAGSSPVDPSSFTNQGDCLANGFSWDNWLPSAGTTTRTNTDGGDYAGMPAGAVIRKPNALEHDVEGPGDFYSGTGWNCLRCHSDQSRAYQERDKPGLVKTRHMKAGDDPSKPFAGYFMADSSSWGLQGVQCGMCHSTAKPAQDDLIQVVPAGLAGAGNPKSATGHNQTEYGAHLLDICYTCHGTAANPPTINPATVIPVSGGEFARTSNLPGPPTSNLGNANCTAAGVPTACCTGPGTGTCIDPPNTAGELAIVNQFLNSPHAQYMGTSTKADIGNKFNYLSTFAGYVCRTAATTVSGSIAPGGAWNATNCPAAGHSWVQPPGATALGCYYNATSCAAGFNTWNAVFDPIQYPVNNGGVCSGVGLGSIITTVYRNGSAEKIHNLDSTTNEMCTNPGNGSSASGAGGYWVKDGELAGLVSLGNPTDTAQGTCMTCHDVHWSIDDTSPEAEPFRRECTTCHVNLGGSASGAPQIDLSTINHSKTAGTPLEDWLTHPEEACVSCHMPEGSGPMHLWRINTDPNYQTMGATQANLAPDGFYTDAAWVDIEHACGQCHGTDGVTPAKPGVPPFTTQQLAQVAEGMHESAGVTYPVTFSIALNGLQVTVTASVECGGTCPTFTYDWDWGDGSAHGTANPGIHPYTSGGSKSIKLTVRLDGKIVGTATRDVTLSSPDLPPTAKAKCTWHADTDRMTVKDKSTDDGPDADSLPDDNPTLQIVVRWGDGATSITTQGAKVKHTYAGTKTYTVTLTAIDAKLQKDDKTCKVLATPGSVVTATKP